MQVIPGLLDNAAYYAVGPVGTAPSWSLTGFGQRADIAKASAAGFDAPPVTPVEPQHRLALVARLTQA